MLDPEPITLIQFVTWLVIQKLQLGNIDFKYIVLMGEDFVVGEGFLAILDLGDQTTHGLRLFQIGVIVNPVRHRNLNFSGGFVVLLADQENRCTIGGFDGVKIVAEQQKQRVKVECL